MALIAPLDPPLPILIMIAEICKDAHAHNHKFVSYAESM